MSVNAMPRDVAQKLFNSHASDWKVIMVGEIAMSKSCYDLITEKYISY